MKITKKQFSGFKQICGTPWGLPSANDGYNLANYGITAAEFSEIKKIAEDAAGFLWRGIKFADVQRLQAGQKVAGCRL